MHTLIVSVMYLLSFAYVIHCLVNVNDLHLHLSG